MANDTVVTYILNVNAKDAQKDLQKTGKEAKDTSQDFEKLSHSTKELVSQNNRLAQSNKQTAQGMRNLRKAGRDLDGSFADLAQGFGLVNPALGDMFHTMSNVASISEGLGRTLVGFLNPAMAGILAVTVLAGAAFYSYQKDQEEAKERADNLKKVIDDTNRTIEEQQSILIRTSQAMQGYISDVNETGTQLALLTGSISQYEYESARATQTANQFTSQALGTLGEEQKALKDSIDARQTQIRQMKIQIGYLEDQRRVEQSLSERVAGVAPKFEQMGLEESNLRRQLKQAEDQLELDKEREATIADQTNSIIRQGDEMEANLEKIAQLKQADRDRAEAQRKADLAKAKRDRDKAQADREAEQARKEAEREAQKLLAAQNTLENMIFATTYSLSSERQKIQMNLQKQLATLAELKATGVDIESLAEAEKLLREAAKRDLDELNEKERKITKEKREQAEKEKEKTAEKEKQDKLDKRMAAASTFGTLATGDVSSIVSMFAPVAGSIVGSLIKMGEQTPAERREQLMAQVEAMKLGISYLPEIFLSILPQLAAAMIEAIVDGFQLAFQNLKDIIKDAFSFRSDSSRDERKDRRQAFWQDFFDPKKSATFAGGGRFLMSAMGGIRYTGQAREGLAMLHQGEYVVPRTGQAPQSVQRELSGGMRGSVQINISSIVTEQNAIDRLVREIEKRFNSQYGVSQSNLFGGR